MENLVEEEIIKKIEKNKNHILQSDLNNFNHSKNNQNEQNNLNNELKIGQFMLTPLEVIILNKKMPHRYKFESEENLLKQLELSKHQSKRIKTSERHGNRQRHLKPEKIQINEDKNTNINKDNLINNNKKLKKKMPKENTYNTNINNNTESYTIMMKCYKGFTKIKSIPNSNFFYFPKSPDSPSLSLIEKKIKNYEYKTVNDFCDDLRKLWNFQFKNYAKVPNTYQNICKMSLLSEQICKELINDNNVKENKSEDIINIKKRTDKLKKDINEFKVNNQNNNNNQNDSHNKIIKHKSIEEINHLGRLIRTLNKPQLKGIIAILSDNNEKNNSKTFEFDLEQLSYEKYQNLDEYVRKCKNQNKTFIKNNPKNENSNIKLNKNKSDNSKSTDETDLKYNLNNHNKSNTNNSTISKTSNIKEKNTNETNKKKEEKKNNSQIKNFSSDSFSSDSSLSN